MYRLADYRSSFFADALADRLIDAGIRASAVMDMTARGGFKQGVTTVWLDHESELPAAQEIRTGFEREAAEQATELTCGKCGYDLRGHAGEGVCPECGQPIKAGPIEITCPHCGESVPTDFEVCWNCGGELRATDTKK